MHLYKIEIVNYFFNENLKFEVGQSHNNWSSQHIQAYFFVRGKIIKLNELKR